MHHKSKGILLRKTKLTSGGYILKIYTLEYGIRSYFGRVNKQNKNKFLPLSLVEIAGFQQPKKTIYSIKDYELSPPLRDVYQNIYKSNVLIFINEILNQVIQEEESNPEKYHFLETKIKELENKEFDSNFHLLFLMQLSSLLGFEPDMNGNGKYYDFADGEKTNYVPTHSHFFDENETLLFQAIYESCYDSSKLLSLSNNSRKKGIRLLVTYYRYHTEMRELKSLPVLEIIFS